MLKTMFSNNTMPFSVTDQHGRPWMNTKYMKRTGNAAKRDSILSNIAAPSIYRMAYSEISICQLLTGKC